MLNTMLLTAAPEGAYLILALAVLTSLIVGWLSFDGLNRRRMLVASVPMLIVLVAIGIAHTAVPAGYAKCSSIGLHPGPQWVEHIEPWGGLIGNYTKPVLVSESPMAYAGMLLASYDPKDPGWVDFSGTKLENGEWVAVVRTYPHGGGSPTGEWHLKKGEPLTFGDRRLTMVEVGAVAPAGYCPARFRFDRT